MCRSYIYTVVLLFLLTVVARSQGDLINEDRIVTYNENSYAAYLNSNGFSLQYRFGKRMDGYKKHIFDVDFSHIKHPKEFKVRNPYYDNQKRFVFGKLNTFMTLRGGWGIQKEQFSKQDKGGVSIKYYYQVGVSLGLLKPVYYEVVDSARIDPIRNEVLLYIGNKKFSSDIHSVSDIYGRSSFFNGFGEMSLVPGAFGKLGISFEYSGSYKYINAIETGVMFDVYSKSVPIMDTENNSRFFITLFIGYRFGKVGIRKDEL
ncbi:MAG: hypothetical protein CVU05_15835 [Bacteroidetes bacterium HGW-Bacteroidetes-21]|jgi:hypothetical protein|nr:MAG: hypothetical protein CVU05_15835 [Bacteroidetes bacterium HGW-Bacteroidetes-21]